jgi:hypothetical protein
MIMLAPRPCEAHTNQPVKNLVLRSKNTVQPVNSKHKTKFSQREASKKPLLSQRNAFRKKMRFDLDSLSLFSVECLAPKPCKAQTYQP